MALSKLYLMANDTKWMENEVELDFIPYPGLNIDGLTGEDNELKISGMSYNVVTKLFKLRLAWLTATPLTSKELLALDVGWKVRT